MVTLRRVGCLVALSAAVACAAPETRPREPQPEPEISSLPDEGEVVRAIVLHGSDSPEAVVRSLEHTRIGEPLSSAGLAEDLKSLWREHRLIVTQVYTQKSSGGGVRVHFDVRDG